MKLSDAKSTILAYLGLLALVANQGFGLQRIGQVNGVPNPDQTTVQRAGLLYEYAVTKRALAWAKSMIREACGHMGVAGKKCLEFSA